MKTLIFEGAGWSKSDSSGDVGNCRIRSTFLNDKGQEIYLELIGVKTHRYSVPSRQKFTIGSHVSHFFYTIDKDSGHSRALSGHESAAFEWTKDNILKFVNDRAGCSFGAIEVKDDWCGFSATGKPDDDFHKKEARQ